jgi:hypothetical protein
MNYKIRSLLLPFYFGSVSDEDRLIVERELLTDSEALVDFFDLKREMEAVQEVPQHPSNQLWRQLRARLKPRRQLVRSFGLGFAACLLALAAIFLRPRPETLSPPKTVNEILFDASSELPVNLNVL